MRWLTPYCLLVLLVSARVLLAQSPEPPMAAEANARFERGLLLFREKNYEGALVELRKAYGITPHSQIIFAIAQAERLAGRCNEALELYQQFLARSPSPEHAKAAESAMSRCDGAAKPPPPPAAPPREVIPPPPSHEAAPVEAAKIARAPTPARTRARAWYRDPWGGLLAGLGLVSTGVGVGLFVAAGSKADQARNSSTYDLYGDEFESAKAQRSTGNILIGTGAALVTAALVRYAWTRGE